MRYKIYTSYAQEQADGSRRGIFTVYGAASEGPWTFSGTGLRVKPWFTGRLWSTDIPTPLLADSICAN